ncbi:chaoptin-like [Anoplophora glabripennis]|uniref:chaoptin-like n=1 Tax=Anoplophora glabripennis TaxID=217634 RepID=UPI0008736033|nr:chaoptin-like [Anoplophora glabripennis]
MNVKAILTFLTFALNPFFVKGYCILTTMELSCRDTNYTNFIQAFYAQSCKTDNISSSLTITLEDSIFYQIKHFPNLPLSVQNSTTTCLTIKSSSVESIDNKAFQELTDLRRLDLSYNKLHNILFVHGLSPVLEVLILNNNNISYVDEVFGTLKHLLRLDLSYNRISILDFCRVFRVQHLNFTHNRIETLIPSKESFKIYELDLSHNKITAFSELELNLAFHLLNLSHNELKSLVLLRNDKKFLGLSATNVSHLRVNKIVKIDELDLSSSTTFLDFGNINIIPTQHLFLKNSKIEVLNRSTLNIFDNFFKFWPYEPRIDLSNSSVKDISPHYFKNLRTFSLNLSSNHIALIKNKVFLNSSIRILDLSSSNIEIIECSAFENLVAEVIRLKGNKLEIVNDIFDGVNVKELDLSFNLFKVMKNHSFVNCRGLVFLNLERCLIERIEPEAFLDLNELQHLTLAYNKLLILEANSFNNLPIRRLILKGNKIDTIRNNAFTNLSNLKELNLSKLGLRNVESYAFYNLSRVETIDLSYNNIAIIPHYLFIDVDNLRTVRLEGNHITTLNPFSSRLKLNTLSITLKGIFKSSQILNSNIRYLHIKDSKIDVLQSNFFDGLYNLMELHFSNSHSYVATGALNNLFKLKYLDSQSLFKHMKTIKQHTFKDLLSLGHLDLSRLSLLHLEEKAFDGMTKLQTLLLNNNNLTELQGDTFYGLESLKTLDLSSSNIGMCDDKSFVGLKSLEVLYLQNNSLTAIESQLVFGSLSSLLDLHLEHNNISSIDMKSFSGLKKLLRLHLQGNNLEDIPIGAFQYLTTLKDLNLSNNLIQLLKTGALSNLQSLESLDLSDNELVNLDYVDIFFSLKQLQTVRFDGNHLKQFDFRRFLVNLKKIKYVGISYNKWKCDTLSYMIESFNNRSIGYKPDRPVFDNDNIDGVGCVDLCKFVYCPPEIVEQTLHNY